MDNFRRNLLVNKKSDEEFVDLGLPSGLLWAKGNIVMSGSKYVIGTETLYGAYFSWGNTVPHFSTNGKTFDDDYDFGTSISGPYASTPGANVSGNILSNDAIHDAALALLGTSWHLPTNENFQELYDNTDKLWTTINGVNGWKFMKKTDHSIYVFFPAAGSGSGVALSYRGSSGYYWSASLLRPGIAYNMYFSDYSIYSQSSNNLYIGCSIRAVQSPPQYVDLDLPSGIKWATGNLKKSANGCAIGGETEWGDFWSWANVGLTNSTGWMSSVGGRMDFTMYDSTNGKRKSDDISGTDATYDVVYKYLGTPWRLPSKADFEELIANTDHEWTTINGVNGSKFMKKTDHSIYVFLPGSGYCYPNGLIGRNLYGHYISSTFYNSSNSYEALIYSSPRVTNGGTRAYGFSVRPVSD